MNDLMPLIVIAAGGTGGHMFPAQALATELSNRSCRLVVITDSRGDFWQGDVQDVEIYRIRAGGLAGKSFLARIESGFELAIGILQARKILKRLNPKAVVGFGGYASIPTMLAAIFSGYPTAIHEQNAVLGKANRLLAKWVKRIATSFEQTQGFPEYATARVVHIGMPLRPALSSVIGWPYPSLTLNGPLSLLVTGGSQGARVLSDVVPRALSLLDESLRRRLRVSQQCRPEDLERTRETYKALCIEADIKTFFDDVPERLASSHLLIGRSGASTAAETLAVGRPSILVPYPHAIDDHQTLNAHAIVEVGAGWLIPEEAFTPTALSARLASLLSSPEILKKSAAAALDAATLNGAMRLADMVFTLFPSNDNESMAA